MLNQRISKRYHKILGDLCNKQPIPPPPLCIWQYLNICIEEKLFYILIVLRGDVVRTLIGNEIQYQIFPWLLGLVVIVINLILFVKFLIWLDLMVKLGKLYFGTFKTPPKTLKLKLNLEIPIWFFSHLTEPSCPYRFIFGTSRG